jgi:hypothetical protein
MECGMHIYSLMTARMEWNANIHLPLLFQVEWKWNGSGMESGIRSLQQSSSINQRNLRSRLDGIGIRVKTNCEIHDLIFSN